MSVHVRASTRRLATVVTLLIIAEVMVVGLMVTARSVHRDGHNCGSLLAPHSVEVVGPHGVNPRPCTGAHRAALVLAITLVVLIVVPATVAAIKWPMTNESA